MGVGYRMVVPMTSRGTYGARNRRFQTFFGLKVHHWHGLQGSHRFSQGSTRRRAILVEAFLYVYAHNMSQAGQGEKYEQMGGLIRVRRGSTEKADFDSCTHLAALWAARRPTRPQYNAMGVLSCCNPGAVVIVSTQGEKTSLYP